MHISTIELYKLTSLHLRKCEVIAEDTFIMNNQFITKYISNSYAYSIFISMFTVLTFARMAYWIFREVFIKSIKHSKLSLNARVLKHCEFFIKLTIFFINFYVFHYLFPSKILSTFSSSSVISMCFL